MRLVANLMRLHKPTKQIHVMAQFACLERGDYRWLWRWVGGDGSAHPHPDCKYWVEDMLMPARLVDEANIIRGDN